MSENYLIFVSTQFVQARTKFFFVNLSAGVLSFKQKDWFMEKFTELCVLGAEDEDEENDGEYHKMVIYDLSVSDSTASRRGL